jgi:hypothetical protein
MGRLASQAYYAGTASAPPPPRYPNWGWNRNDAGDYAQLAAALRRGMRPVRPAGKPVPRIPGQLRLF